MGKVHPLVPVCLDSETHVIDNSRVLIDLADDRTSNIEGPVLLLQKDHILSARFDVISVPDHPPIKLINESLSNNLEYIRKSLLTTTKITAHIQQDIALHRYDLIVLLLIDGLGYGDALEWEWDTVPCFVDGPSVTFQTDTTGNLIPSIGFPNIVGNPSIASRLYDLGYHSAFGYTYWKARNNLVSGYLFRGIQDNEVANFDSIIHIIGEQEYPPNSYIQIVREGLDGLAHSKRELHKSEIQTASQSIKADIERLLCVIQTKSQSAVMYIVADHGILWKNEHDWQVIGESSSKSRYTTTSPDRSIEFCTVRFDCSHHPYYLYTYPYLGRPIRKNDSGVHGGLSYQESFVPFIKIEA